MKKGSYSRENSDLLPTESAVPSIISSPHCAKRSKKKKKSQVVAHKHIIAVHCEKHKEAAELSPACKAFAGGEGREGKKR